MKGRLAVLALIALTLVWITGCSSKQGQIVAKVGKINITTGEIVKDYLDMKKNMQVRIVSNLPEYDQFKQFLDQKIDSKLLVQAAYEKGLDKDPQITSRLDQEKDKILMSELFRVEILDKIKITDKDVADLYKKLGESIKVKHILVKTKKEADQIYEELKKEAVFDSLARQKSIDPGSKDRGGDLGYINWNTAIGGTPLIPFKDVVYKLKPQEISRPVKTFLGWHIIKVEDTRKETQKSFEEEKDRLRMSLQMTLQQETAINYMVDLMEKTDIKIVSSTQKMLEEKAKALAAQDTSRAQIGAINIDPNQLSEQEKSSPFLKYKGGELNVDKFLQFYNGWPVFQRPPLEDEENLKGMLFNYLLAPELLKKVSQQKKIDKSQEFKDKVERIKENLMGEKYRNDVIWKDLVVDKADLEAFYENNKDKYIVPPQAHVLEIMVKTEDEAKAILKQLRAGVDFKKLAQEKTIRTYVKNSGGDLGNITKSNYPELFDEAFKLKKGQLAGPIHILQSPVGEGYSVIKLLEKEDQRQKTFEEMEPQLKGGATFEKRGAVSKQWVAEARAKTQIKIYEPTLQSAFKMVQKELPQEKA